MLLIKKERSHTTSDLSLSDIKKLNELHQSYAQRHLSEAFKHGGEVRARENTNLFSKVATLTNEDIQQRRDKCLS